MRTNGPPVALSNVHSLGYPPLPLQLKGYIYTLETQAVFVITLTSSSTTSTPLLLRLISCLVTQTDPFRRTRCFKLETMAEHNIVVFAGDHCGPGGEFAPRAILRLTWAKGVRLTVVIWIGRC